MRRTAIAAIMGLALSPSVLAAGGNERYAALDDGLLGGLVQERDVSLVFDYLRDALGAAFDGRELPPPEVLAQRAEAISGEVKRRGAALGRALIDAIELAVRESIKQPSRPEPPRPLQRMVY